MAASTLRYERSSAKTQETKSGIPVYDGSPSGFFEWEFRTLLKLQSCADDDERKKLGARVCEGLTGEAFKCAMDIGLTELGKENGVPQLVAKLRTLIFPQQSSEARELYKIGQQRHGPLSRQQPESMTSYVQKRKRWWTLLTQMDKSLSMSEVMLGELLLEHAGLTSTERLMVMTSTNNDLDFNKVAEALVKQHALSKESTRDYHSGKGKGGKAKGHWRSNASRGYLAYEDDGDYEYPDEEYGQAGEAYLGYDTSGYDGWEAWDGYDASTAWFHDETWEEGNPEEEMNSHVVYEEMIDSCTPEELANPAMAAANTQAAYLSGDYLREAEYEDHYPSEAYWTIKGKFKGKGKGKFKGKFRPKGKGFGKWKGGKKGYPGGNLSLEDRRRRLQEFKSKTKCQDCGKIGHWAGDQECPKSNKKASAHIAFARNLDCIRGRRWDSSRIWRQAFNGNDGIARWRRIAGRTSLGLARWCWDCIIVCRNDNRRSCSIRCKLETVEGPRCGVPISSVQRIYLQRGCAERFGIHDLGHGHIEKPQGIGNQTVPSLVEPSSEENHEWTEDQESRWKDCSKFLHGDTCTFDSS